MKKLLIISILVITGLVLFARPQPAMAQLETAKNEACQGVTSNSDPNAGGCDSSANNAINNLLKNAINIFSFVIGVITVIMVMIGGVKYITSNGDPATVNSAKNTILYAIVGLIVVLLSQVIVHFVLTKVGA